MTILQRNLTRSIMLMSILSVVTACSGPVKKEQGVQQKAQEAQITDENRLEQQKMRRSLLFALIADSRLETLSEYVVANNMSELFSTDPGPFLFFTPINVAFENVDSTTRKLWSDQSNGVVKSLINKHLIQADTLVDNLSFYVGQDLQTRGGMRVKVVQDQDVYYLEDVKGKRALITPNPMRMDNGFIYYIDQLLHRP